VKKWGIFGAIWLGLLLVATNVSADQTGDCTAGSQYCEQNSL